MAAHRDAFRTAHARSARAAGRTHRRSLAARQACRTRRRGNTLVLVTAILVLLVIVATAFISRTQASRQVSSAQQQAIQRDDRAFALRDEMAGILRDALFPQPVNPTALSNPGRGFRVDPTDPTIRTATSSWERLRIEPDARLFSIDRDKAPIDLNPDFAYNVAPYETKPWTNWPDFLSPNFPFGPGQPNGTVVGAGNTALGDWNPWGNPGFGDSRWLRSTEPVRIDTNGDGIPDTFSHWAHLSWIATANNGFRVVKDISDIIPNTLTNMDETVNQPFAVGLPYEQWLPNFPPAGVSNAAAFRTRVNDWFSSTYANVYASSAAMPNFFRLKDLPADLRAEVNKTLADTDGDGFTDAFWFLAPTSVERSLRYLVAVSVVDNSALVNVNTATRFNRQNTIGSTPADLALIGDPETIGRQVGIFDNPTFTYEALAASPAIPTLFLAGDADANTGLYAPAFVGWTRNRFGDDSLDSLTFLQVLGMKDAGGNVNPFIADNTFPANQQAEWYSPVERLRYWKEAALRGDLPGAAITPFSIGDEMELRAFHGANSPWVLSRLERALNTQLPSNAFLRSMPERVETNENLFQLSNRGLMLDNRRKLTTISGARNDLIPAWLWPTPYPDPRVDYNRDNQVADTNGDLVVDDAAAGNLDFAAYLRQTKRIDLRRAMDDPDAGSSTPPIPAVIEARRRDWRADVRNVLERTLTRSWQGASGQFTYQSYLGRPEKTDQIYQRQQYDKTLQMVASMTANIDQWRDSPVLLGSGNNLIANDSPLHPLDAVQDPIDNDLRYIGMEKQPYLMEVFIGVVYPKSRVSDALKAELIAAGIPVTNDYEIPQVFLGGGENFVDSSSKPGMVVAVQIANPHDTPINLAQFQLRIAGKTYAFATGTYGPGVVIGPATEAGPTSAIVYAINASNTEPPPAGFPFAGTWLDFLDIETAELYTPSGDAYGQTKIFDAASALQTTLTSVNSPATDPSNDFNDPNGDLIELIRTIPASATFPGAQPAAVVVDRFDNRESGEEVKFSETLARLFTDDTYFPPIADYDFDPTNPPDRNYMDGIRIGNNDYFVTWCRASRVWTWDTWPVGQTAGDGVFSPDEINPRFVASFASDPTLPTKVQQGTVGGADRSYRGDTYAFDQDPDGTNLWISYSYRNIFGAERRGKPTFFTNAVREQAGVADNIYGLGFPYPNASGQYPANVVIGDKGLQADDWTKVAKYNFFRSPFQMLQKDADVDQVGELMHVFCWGHVIDVSAGVTQPDTERTFSELLLQQEDTEDQPVGRGIYTNRLRITPFIDPAALVNGGSPNGPTDGPTPVLSTPPSAPWVPALPAGSGLFDAFVCDDRGAKRLDANNNGVIEVAEVQAAELRRVRNAAGYAESLTPGLVNIQTALPETLASLPHMTRLVNNDFNYGTLGGQLSFNPVNNPFTRVVDSMLRYRDRSILPASGTIVPGAIASRAPYYVDRGLAPEDTADTPWIDNTPGFLGPVLSGATVITPGMRGDRGFASLGELALLQRTADETNGVIEEWNIKTSYSMEFAGLNPLRTSSANPAASGIAWANGVAPRISTDVNPGRNTLAVEQVFAGAGVIPDRIAGDVEERNLLLSGISNMVSVRSDVFTVYIRVRAVKQDPVTGKWDATNDELLVDDSRYVMIVDRSNVKTPADQPRILGFQRVESPN